MAKWVGPVGPSRWTIQGRLLPTYVTSHKASSSNATTYYPIDRTRSLSHTLSIYPAQSPSSGFPLHAAVENLPDSLSASLYFPILEFSNKLVLGFFRPLLCSIRLQHSICARYACVTFSVSVVCFRFPVWRDSLLETVLEHLNYGDFCIICRDNFFRLLYWLHLRTPALNNPSSDLRPPDASGAISFFYFFIFKYALSFYFRRQIIRYFFVVRF